jgi:arylsulfatase A-like enzyme
LKVSGAGLAGASLLAGCERRDGPRYLPDRARSADKPTNVVLLIMDSLRKDHVGAFGNDWIETPNLDALAKESLRFTRAYPESAPTICARRAIHTGLRTWPFEGWQRYKGINVGLQGWQPIPNDQTTLAETMQQAGYETVFITDNLQQYDASMNFQRGFDAYDFIRGQTTDTYRPLWTAPPDKMMQVLIEPAVVGAGSVTYFQQYFANTAYRRSEQDWFAPQVFTRAAEYLEGTDPNVPFFLTVDCYDPHPPWDPPEKYANMYDDAYHGPEPYAPVEGSSDYLNERQLGRMGALYAGEVTMTDRWLGLFLARMEELGLFENTLLIAISDHGVAFGEHGIVGKIPASLWPEVTDIVLLVRHPEGKGAGETNDYYASTHDVAPTVLGFCGIEPQQELEGQNLTALLEHKEPKPRPHFSLGYHDHVFTRDENHAMISRNDGTEAKLYDLKQDPTMQKNIAYKKPKTAKQMFDNYIIKDAGGPLPTY